MFRSILYLGYILIAFTFSSTAQSSKYPLSIYVRDANTGKPLIGALVHVNAKSDYTIRKGEAHFNRVSEGAVRLRVEHDDYVSQERYDFNVSSNPEDNVVWFFLKKMKRADDGKDDSTGIVSLIKGTGVITDENNRPLRQVRLDILVNNVRKSVFTDSIGIYEFTLDISEVHGKYFDLVYIINHKEFNYESIIEPIKGRKFINLNIQLKKTASRAIDIIYWMRPSPVTENIEIQTSENTSLISNDFNTATGKGRLSLIVPERNEPVRLAFHRTDFFPVMKEVDLTRYLQYPSLLHVRQKRDHWLFKRTYIIPGVHSFIHESRPSNKWVKGVLQSGIFTTSTILLFNQLGKIKDAKNAIAVARSINEIMQLNNDLSDRKLTAAIYGTIAVGTVVFDFFDIPDSFKITSNDELDISSHISLENSSGFGIGYSVKF